MEVKKTPVTVYAEATPNPSVMKFVANKLLLEGDSIEFKNIEEAQVSPMVSKLYHFPFVKEVFLARNFISITKYDIVEWEDVGLEIREFIREFIHNGGTVITETPASNTATESNSDEENQATFEAPKAEELGEIETRIVDILDEYIRPAVESDGGNILFKSYNDGVVEVVLQGACSGCPSSTITLKQGIENLLKDMLPTLIKEVVAVNG